MGDQIGIFGVEDIKNENANYFIFGSHRIGYKILNNNFETTIYKKFDNSKKNKSIKKNTNCLLFSNKNQIEINDDVVLLDIFPQYHHFLIDSIGKFLYIKKYNNNAKPFFINYIDDNENIANKNHRNQIEYILNKFNEHFKFEYNIDISKNKNGFLFKNIYSLDGPGNIGPQSMAHVPDTLLLLRNLFIPKRESKKNRNIFISRKKIFSRNIDEIEKLESLFRDENYEIIFCEDLSFEEQINMFFDAKNIVAISGTSLTNIIFANTNVNIISFNIDLEYDPHEYRFFSKLLGIKHIDFYIDTHNAKEIFNLLINIKKIIEKEKI